MSRLRLACLALIAAPALLLAAPAEAHRGSSPGRSAGVAPAADSAPVPLGATSTAQSSDARARVAPPAARPTGLAWVAAPRSAVPWALLIGAVGVALPGTFRRPRAALALGLVVFVGVLAFESGVHSVHHLGDPGRASGCALASTSLNLSGLEVEPIGLDRTLAAIGPSVPAAVPSDARALPESPHEGRAPPHLV